jgi:hypothetical protein
MKFGSKEVAKAAVRIALTANMDDEKKMKKKYADNGARTCAVNFGGEFITSVMKIVESSVVAAKRENIIENSLHEEGAMAGAVREAVSQITNKAIGLNVGGKIGIARQDDHIAVCIFFGIGLLHLNEVAIGLGHRVI